MHKKVRVFVRAKLLFIMTLFFGYLSGFGSAVLAGIVRGQRLAQSDFYAVWIIIGLAAIMGLGTIIIALHDANKEVIMVKGK